MGEEVVHAYVADGKLVVAAREGGKVVRRAQRAEHVAYFREGEIPEELLRQLQRGPHVTACAREGEWWRVTFFDGDTRRALCFDKRGGANPLLARGVPTYEADVDPVVRYMVDSGARIAAPRRCYFDIETDSRVPFARKAEARVLAWTVVDHASGEATCDVLGADADGAEADLLGRMWEALEPYDQVAAWYGDGFDFPVVWARSLERGLRGVDARRLLYLDHLEVFRRMNAHAAESGEEKQSMALQNIAQAVLGEGKEVAPEWVVARFGDRPLGRMSWDLWAAGGEFRRLLLRYCVKDTLLLRGIERKTGYCDLFATLCQVCGVFGDTRGLNPTAQMDGFLLRLAKERGIHFPSKVYREEGSTKKYKGADVQKPRSLDAEWRKKMGMETGIARGVHAADFASFYPSVIIAWNMSAETKDNRAPVNGPIPEGDCRCPLTGVSFRTGEKGLLPLAVDQILTMRKSWNDKKASLPPGTPEWHDANRRSMAYKVAANSFYGVVGSPFSRYFDPQVAEGVTQNAAWLIRQTIAAAEARGWECLYMDTDSAYVIGCSRREFEEFVVWCNAELYPAALAKVGCRETGRIKIAYEKEFRWIVFTAAKKYVATYAHYKGKEAVAASMPEIKGLEYVRGDASLLARRLQGEVLQRMLADDPDPAPFHDLVARAREHVMGDTLSLAEVVLAKGLSKPLKDYATKKKGDGTDAAQPPHVVVAKLMKARGMDVSEGTKVEYVVVDDEAEDPAKRFALAEDYRGEVDRHHVWESQVYPPTQRLLEAAYPARAAEWEGWAKSRPRGRAARTSGDQGGLFGRAETSATRPTAPLVLVSGGGRK